MNNEAVNFPALVIALKAWNFHNVNFTEPNKLQAGFMLIKIQGFFLKTALWQYPFHNANEVLNILAYEQLLKIDQVTKNKILFRYDLETLSLTKLLSTFDKKIY